jgi:hypothetical protein
MQALGGDATLTPSVSLDVDDEGGGAAAAMDGTRSPVKPSIAALLTDFVQK